MLQTGSPEYLKALQAERYRRFETKSRPTRVTGQRRLDLPARLFGRGAAADPGSRAA